jgi:hypothetical protein
MATPRGIRNKNPGNIEDGAFTQAQVGYVGREEVGRFATFATMAHGIAAILRLLIIYRTKHGLRTIRGKINRWAPPFENSTSAYVDAVANELGVGPDDPLGSDHYTYTRLARAIARHECGRAAHDMAITDEDYALAAVLAFGPAPSQEQPPVVASHEPPAKQEAPMPAPLLFPIITAAAQSLMPVVADIFRAHGSKVAERNADIIDKAGPALVDIAKAVTGQPTAEQAVEVVLTDPVKREEFRAAVATDVDKLVGMVERLHKLDEDSRDRAATRAKGDKRDFAPLLIERQFVILAVLSLATLAAFVLALILKASNEVLVGLLVLFTGIVNKAYDKWGSIFDYRFGSSAGSAAKDEVIAAQRAQK